MKWWRRLALGICASFTSLVAAGTAFAQNGEEPPILSALLMPAQLAVRLAILVNETLGFWVSDDYTLTEPLGGELVSGMAVIMPALVDFWAAILNVF